MWTAAAVVVLTAVILYVIVITYYIMHNNVVAAGSDTGAVINYSAQPFDFTQYVGKKLPIVSAAGYTLPKIAKPTIYYRMVPTESGTLSSMTWSSLGSGEINNINTYSLSPSDDYFPLGDTYVAGSSIGKKGGPYAAPNTRVMMVSTASGDAKRPADYGRTIDNVYQYPYQWDDRGLSDHPLDISVWRPIAPSRDYICIGDVTSSEQKHSVTKPSTSRIACIPRKCVKSVGYLDNTLFTDPDTTRDGKFVAASSDPAFGGYFRVARGWDGSSDRNLRVLYADYVMDRDACNWIDKT